MRQEICSFVHELILGTFPLNPIELIGEGKARSQLSNICDITPSPAPHTVRHTHWSIIQSPAAPTGLRVQELFLARHRTCMTS